MKNVIALTAILVLFLFVSGCKNETTPEEEMMPPEDDIVVVDSDWFEVSYLEPKSYIIEERQSSQKNVSYLILGEEKAIMFDTGSGENPAENGLKIKPIMDQITTLPITLLLSHFHFDHNQNIAEFDWVAFPDIPLLRQSISADDVYLFTEEDLFLGTYPAQVEVNEWLPVNEDIDLGNRIIQVVNIQGHTEESVAIIDKTNKLAFLGDYLYNDALFLFDNADLVPYEQTVDYLISTLDSEYQVFGAHGKPEVNFEKLQTLKDFLRCIADDVCQSTTTTVFGEPVHFYQYQGMSMVIFQ